MSENFRHTISAFLSNLSIQVIKVLCPLYFFILRHAFWSFSMPVLPWLLSIHCAHWVMMQRSWLQLLQIESSPLAITVCFKVLRTSIRLRNLLAGFKTAPDSCSSNLTLYCSHVYFVSHLGTTMSLSYQALLLFELFLLEKVE